MVFHDRPVYQEEHAAQLIMARSLHSPHKGRIHLRRSVDPLFAFPLQSDGGPYISGKFAAQFLGRPRIADSLAENAPTRNCMPETPESPKELPLAEVTAASAVAMASAKKATQKKTLYNQEVFEAQTPFA